MEVMRVNIDAFKYSFDSHANCSRLELLSDDIVSASSVETLKIDRLRLSDQ